MPSGRFGSEGTWRNSDVSYEISDDGTPTTNPVPSCPVSYVDDDNTRKVRALVVKVFTKKTEKISGSCTSNYDWEPMLTQAKKLVMDFVAQYQCPSPCSKQFFQQDSEYIFWDSYVIIGETSCTYSLRYQFWFACNTST